MSGCVVQYVRGAVRGYFERNSGWIFILPNLEFLFNLLLRHAETCSASKNHMKIPGSAKSPLVCLSHGNLPTFFNDIVGCPNPKGQ